MTEEAKQVSAAFMALVNVAQAAGAKDIGALPACFEHKIDDIWWYAVNGGSTPRLASNGVEVPGFAFYVERNGWPAGIVFIHGGTIIAGAEDELIAACRAAEAALKGGAA